LYISFRDYELNLIFLVVISAVMQSVLNLQFLNFTMAQLRAVAHQTQP